MERNAAKKKKKTHRRNKNKAYLGTAKVNKEGRGEEETLNFP